MTLPTLLLLLNRLSATTAAGAGFAMLLQGDIERAQLCALVVIALMVTPQPKEPT